jgi:DNA (cytosine-5)-methyltransferase 1
MLHLGDITKIRGYEAPVVDCVIGGSPCQDLSVAGKRAGLDGERSGLFMDQIRIVKEMREHDARTRGGSNEHIRPRYMVWENVPGAFSSNKGDDFRIVLEEIAKVADKDAAIPMPDKGKWATSGCIVGEGWSIAWRILDAQFWGVPQRRRRIALVADFGGHSAPEILFVRKSVSGHTDESLPKRKGASSDAEGSLGADDCIGYDGYNGELTGSKTSTLGVNCGMSTGRNGVITVGAENRTAYGISSYNSNAMKSSNPHSGIYEADTSRTLDLNCGNPSCNQGGIAIVESVPYTLKIRSGCEGGGKGALIQEDKSATLSTLQDQTLFQPVYALDRASFNQGKNAKYDFEVSDKGVNSPLVARGPGAVCMAVDCRNGTEDDVNGALQSNSARSLNGNNVVRTHYIVRRLTPLECERLQGFPDGWTDIGEWIDSNGKRKQSSDAARYKALGNSIAIPPWKWVLKRLCACYERDATMASLFDGIGGFPLIWEQLNGKGSCLWASEIEEFPMAVTKRRFNE